MRLTKGDKVVVHWKPSYYRGDAFPSTGTYEGRTKKGEYIVRTRKGVAHLKDRDMIRILPKVR